MGREKNIMEKLIIVYITASNKREAKKIGKKLVEARLAACANVFDGVSSLYWWEDKIQNDAEAAVILKTRESLFEELSATVKEIHSYSCPCVVAMPITNASKDYADWVIKETR